MEGSTSSQVASVSYFGSVMLQALLSLPSSTPLVSALLALPSDTFLRLASDARGVHVLESVLVVGHSTGFSHSLTHQHALVDLVIAHLLPLSHSVAGSFLVEKAYRAADSHRKRTISSQLASQQKALQRSKSGQALLRTCGLQSGKPSVDVSPHLIYCTQHKTLHHHSAVQCGAVLLFRAVLSSAAITATGESVFHATLLPMAAQSWTAVT